MWLRPSTAFYSRFSLDMDRSPGFGSTSTDFRPFKTWFPFGSVPSWYLTSPACTTRRTVLQKVRGSTFNSSSTACRHRVSGSLSLPSRGPFHLSFTVLYSIGHWVVFSLRGWSPFLPTRFHVSRSTLDPTDSAFMTVRGFHPL